MSEANDRYVSYILSRLDADEYPSHELMDRVELAFTSQEHVAAYLEILFDKVDSCHYPSRFLLDRIARFAPMV